MIDNVIDIRDQLAYACECGCPEWFLLRSGKVQCAGCLSMINLRWMEDSIFLRKGRESTTTEHDKRSQTDLALDINKAYSYVESVVWTADIHEGLLWHGWALREAFLAGMSEARRENAKSKTLEK